MAVRNMKWLLDTLKFVVSYDNQGNAQDFVGPRNDPNKYFREALNEAYKQEVEEAQEQVGEDAFLTYEDVTWPANSVTFEFPRAIVDKQWMTARDITDASDGPELDIGDVPEHYEIWQVKRGIYQWGTTGAPRTTTIRIFYLREAEELVSDAQEPELIPSRFRWLIVWSAALILRLVSDDAAGPPPKWEKQQTMLRERFIKAASRGRLAVSSPPVIRMRDNAF